MNFINKLVRNEEGATAIEYGLIAALIAVAAITGMSALATSLDTTFESIGDKVESTSGNL